MLSKSLIDAERVFVGKRFDVRALDVSIPGLPGVSAPGARNDGESYRKEVIVHPGAVVILPLLDLESLSQVVMIRNERIATGETLWELPAGTLEPPPPPPVVPSEEAALASSSGETLLEAPDRCATRELIEETGYEAETITKLVEFYTTPGFCTELMYAFLATGLTHVGQRLEPSEKITVEVLTLERTMRMVHDNVIRDGKTIATLLYYHAFSRNEH